MSRLWSINDNSLTQAAAMWLSSNFWRAIVPPYSSERPGMLGLALTRGGARLNRSRFYFLRSAEPTFIAFIARTPLAHAPTYVLHATHPRSPRLTVTPKMRDMRRARTVAQPKITRVANHFQ